MPIASFGSKVFTASRNKIYTFDGLTRSGSLNIEEQEVEGQKPSTYIKGSTLEDVSLSVKMFRNLGVNIENEIDSWMDIKDTAKPYILMMGNAPIGKNKFLLTDVSVQDNAINGQGKYIKATIQLQFKEFVRYGKNKDTETSSESKTTKKRTNPNASSSIANGAKLDALELEIFGG